MYLLLATWVVADVFTEIVRGNLQDSSVLRLLQQLRENPEHKHKKVDKIDQLPEMLEYKVHGQPADDETRKRGKLVTGKSCTADT